MSTRTLCATFVLALALSASPAHAGYSRDFPAGSLVIPMDLAYQDTGMLQAYGLVFALLSHDIRVFWVIDETKTWHHAACDTPGDECAWECADEGSGPCPYPTASPDFSVGAMVLWDGDGNLGPGDMITQHGYRGGPFVVDAADADEARMIVDAWNDQTQWGANPWADRSVFHVVSVHETTAQFTGNVRKEMIQEPTIAVFSDGNERIATGYLRAAGIPQSNGSEFPDAACGAGTCGPGTANPDMLTVESIMGDMGTCEAPNTDHSNGALFNADGTPAYCQIMSMHWNVADRETVTCEGGCPDTQAECAGETFTYHGHEVVAEVRAFLSFPTHFFAECQAVNAYENTVPNPAWPYLDDNGRRGHFLTTTGMPPDCPCTGATDTGYSCVTNGCDNGTRDCCLPSDVRERGAGFLIADQPNSNDIQMLNVSVPYNQLDGAFETTGGSEPAYNLSSYLNTQYINDLDVTFITGPMGPGDEDVWMTGFVDGECDINEWDEFRRPGECQIGKVSYLGGHSYDTNVPISGSGGTQGTRLFLNALFEADCVTGALSGDRDGDGRPDAMDAFPDDPMRCGDTDADGCDDCTSGTFDPARDCDRDGDGSPDDEDAFPDDPTRCGDSDSDTCDDCSSGTFNTATDCDPDPDRDGDGALNGVDEFPDDPTRCGDSDTDMCDDCASGTFNTANDCDVMAGGCGCHAVGSRSGAPLFLLVLALVFLRRRRS